MAIIKCKMCGGNLNLIGGASTAECEFCGSVQTVPNLDDEKKLIQFERAERLRKQCDFDKAAGIYESIVADYRQEAEAYWGLVLCKYGIEYVDDPATGKKIPTCHRSSFDSVMDDINFEMAMENADEKALRVYRQEAKQIESIRKGILEVSSCEEPYDIFICYKETDPNGDRTVDSLLAQDIYDALTAKGYRVFFSRITLEDKLGQAYEPYIFSALNSAKIMLAVGTCYEYYNAVWVKNEWSRYIKIIAQDKSKYLIPCYKGIDPYDIPKEFAHLQGQDMGKVGAIQDLLRGIDKILPKQSNTAVIQERVVVGGGGDNKIASLLDRGNMALEDGDWEKADSFFEDVLNNDSKNAQAYLGKTLAQERCRTIDAFARKRKGLYQNTSAKTLSIPEDKAHIEEMIKRCYISGYLETESIRKIYEFDRSYQSLVDGRKAQLREEEKYWENHKLLSRAEKFSTGAVAQTLASEKKALFDQLQDAVKRAEESEKGKQQDKKLRYASFLAEADGRVSKLNEEARRKREQDYSAWLQIAKGDATLEQLKDAGKFFAARGSFEDSKALAAHCESRIAQIIAERQRIAAEEKAAAEAEAERQRIIAAEEKARKQAQMKKISIISAIIAVVAIVAVLVVTQVVIPSGHFKAAQALLDEGRYEEAIAAFEAMDGYGSSEDMIIEAQNHIAYEAAEQLLSAGFRADAIAAFATLGEFGDSAQRIEKIQSDTYAEAEQKLAEGDTVHAAMLFGSVADYRDARQRSLELWGEVVTPSTIAIDSLGTVAVKADGTAVAAGNNKYHQFDLEGWTDIVGVSRNYMRTIGWKADGTVVVAGSESEVSSWTDIVSISAGDNVIGLKSDGTVVVALGNTKATDRTGQWQDVVAVSAYGEALVGLTSQGKVLLDFPLSVTPPYDVSDWSDIVAVDAGSSHIVGLRSDGAVVATVVGLRSDGAVVATGNDNNEAPYNMSSWVSSWKDIVMVSVGHQHTVGVKTDGTVVAVGHNYYGQCDVSAWTDIVSVVAGPYYTVGLKSDGTVLAVGSDKDGKLDVSSWRDMAVPQKQTESLALQKQSAYQEAEQHLAEGNFDKAIEVFQGLGDYEDAPERVLEVFYAKGELLLASNAYSEAAEIFDQLGKYKESPAKLDEAKWGLIKTADVDDVITFGSYEQDGDSANGKEPIQWIVAARNGDELVLLSKYILGTMPFDNQKSNNWNSSSINKWLNDSFLSETYSAFEQEKIVHTSAGKVYLMSVDELEKYFGDLSIYSTKVKLAAKLTAASGRYGAEENWWWWTRTSDGYHNAANCVKYISEYGGSGGNDASWPGGGVRPAITINVGD